MLSFCSQILFFIRDCIEINEEFLYNIESLYNVGVCIMYCLGDKLIPLFAFYEIVLKVPIS